MTRIWLRSIPTIALLLSALPLAAQSPAVSNSDEITTEQRAEAYYLYSVGRMYKFMLERRIPTEDTPTELFDKAIASFEEAIKTDPAAAYPHMALAEMYSLARENEKAVQSAKRALELDGDVAAAHRLLGQYYFRLLRNAGGSDMVDLAIQEFREAVRLEPADIESRSTLARLLFASRKTDEAVEQLEEILRFDPTAYYEMFLLAQAKRDAGDNETAISLLKQSLSVEPRQAEAQEMLVSMLQAEGRFDEIVDIYQRALDGSPEDTETRLRLADAFANNGQSEDAAREFELVLKEDPENTIAMVGLAMVRRDLKELDEAERLLGEALSRNQANALARFTLAGVYEEKREYQKAAVEWRRLIDAPPRSGEPEGRRAEYWAHLGFVQQQLGHHDEAIEAFTQALDKSGNDARFEVFRIQALLAGERADEAQVALGQARERHPDDLRMRMLEPRVLEAQGKEEEAIEMALRMVKEDASGEVDPMIVVELYQSSQRFADAEVFLREQLESSPEDISILFQMGAVLERQKKFSEAETYFRKILEKNPDSPAVLNYLGYMLADQDVRLEESLDYIQRAVGQDPYNGAFLDSLGWVYFKLGKLDLAEEHLLRAIDSLRLTGVVYDHLGDLYFEKGELDEAIRFWQKALTQDDDELEKDTVARKIEKASSIQ